jgi:hypothetical protein
MLTPAQPRPAQWNDFGTRPAGGCRTVGGKHATFTAGFWADRAISEGPHKNKISSQYMALHFLLNSFV